MKCQHCATPMPGKRANRKWCDLCRALKSVIALGDYPATCGACGNKFYRHDGKIKICHHCNPSIAHNAQQVTCAICDNTGPGLGKVGIAICLDCVSIDNDKRHVLVQKVCDKKLRQLEAAPDARAAAEAEAERELERRRAQREAPAEPAPVI